jgi:hypothetical protein
MLGVGGMVVLSVGGVCWRGLMSGEEDRRPRQAMVFLPDVVHPPES